MRRIPAWVYLSCVFAVFLVILAIVLIVSDFPFIVISVALSSILMLSIVIVGLAWAYQNNW
jgi:hypothetical protein